MNILTYGTIALLSLLAILILQGVYDDRLLAESLTTISAAQAGSTSATQGFLSTFVVFNKLLIIAPFLVTYFMTSQRSRSFYYLMLIYFTFALCAFTKLVFIQPRPFWVSPTIQAFQCFSDFGNPGQSMTFATATLIVGYLDLQAWSNEQMETVMANQEMKVTIWASWWTRSGIILVSSGFAAFIGYASFFTGACSGNQVLLGFQLGIWVAGVFHFMIRDYLFDSIQKRLDGAASGKAVQILIWTSSLYVFALIVQIINYENSMQSELPVVWINNLVSKCGQRYMRDSFQDYSLIEFGHTAFALGAFIGIILQQMYYPALLSSGPKKDNFWKALGRFGMAIAVSAPWIILMFSLKYGVTERNVYTYLFFETLIPALSIGFSFFFLADIVNVRIGLLETDASAKGDAKKDGNDNDEEEIVPEKLPEEEAFIKRRSTIRSPDEKRSDHENQQDKLSLIRDSMTVEARSARNLQEEQDEDQANLDDDQVSLLNKKKSSNMDKPLE